MSTETPYEQIEAEIDKHYGEIELSQKPLSKFLKELELKPLRKSVMSQYSSQGGRRKYDPVAIAFTLIYEELGEFSSRRQLLRRLRRNLNEAKDLGYTLENGVPEPQNINYFLNSKIDAEIEKLIQHTAEYIRERNQEDGKIEGIAHVEKEQEEDEKLWKEQVKDKKFQEVSNFLQWKVFPRINFGRASNQKYDDAELLDFLTFTAMRNVCTNEGYNLLTEIVDKDIPTSQNLLHHIRELERNEIYQMYESANERIIELAKEEGRLDQPVDVAIDFTNIQYYGDKNDNMVVETQPKNGTTHAYQFATIKIVSGGEHYTLKALPVNKFSNKRDIVEELLDHAEKHIEIRRVYADRGFFSGKIINLFQERNQKFIMPAVRNQKVKQFLEEEEAPAIVRYTMKGKETSTFNLAIKKPENEDDPKPFATNCTQLEILGNNLFELYGRRWDIETGYRVQKNNFYPKTTSKNYNVRLFYFLFSQLLYNTWTLTNVKISLHLHDEIREEKEITAQEFVTKFFQAFLDYG